VGFLKIASIPMERLHELEKETLRFFSAALTFRYRNTRGRQITRDEREYQQFLTWLEKYIADSGTKLQIKSNAVRNSAVRDKLILVTAIEARTDFCAEGSAPFSLNEDQSIINDLQQHKLLCSELMVRYHRLSLAYDRCYRVRWEDYAAFFELWKKVMTRATGVLSSVPSSIGNVGTILESLGWLLCDSFDGSMYYQDALEELGVTTTSHIRDSLGRTAAHQWLDRLDGVICFDEDRNGWDDFKNTINLGTRDLDAQDFLGRTLLHIACQKRWYCGTVWLLENGANPGSATGYGSLPLHYAAAIDSKPICKLLLAYRHSFDVHERDRVGLTALHYATTLGDAEVIELFDEESSESENETVIKEATTTTTTTTTTEATAREDSHGYYPHPTITTSEHIFDYGSDEGHQPQITHQPLLHSVARAEPRSNPGNSSAIFGGHSTSSDRFFTANASPAVLTIERNEFVKPLVVVIEYALFKSAGCNIEDIQVVSAMIEKLHLYLYGRVKGSCAEQFDFISSMEILFVIEPQSRHALSVNLLGPGSDSWNTVVAPTVFTAMRYVEKNVQSLMFGYKEYCSVDRVIRATKLLQVATQVGLYNPDSVIATDESQFYTAGSST
jgi:hypothetical protein